MHNFFFFLLMSPYIPLYESPQISWAHSKNDHCLGDGKPDLECHSVPCHGHSKDSFPWSSRTLRACKITAEKIGTLWAKRKRTDERN